MRTSSIALVLALFLALSPACAGGAQLHLAPSLGLFDVGKGEKAGEAGLELRLPALWWGIQPIAGGMATADEALYGYLGGRREFALGALWSITPTLAAGAYSRGDGKELGRTLEFRSGLELARRLPRGRLGLTYYHLSNASLSDTNPGSESLVLSWELPLSR